MLAPVAALAFGLALQIPAAGQVEESAAPPSAAPAPGAPGQGIAPPGPPVYRAPESTLAGPPAAAVDFASTEAVLDLGSALSPGRVSDPAQPGAVWFTVNVANRGAGLAARVLLAADPPDAGVSFAPLERRPTLVEAAASDNAVLVESAAAFGSNAIRVILPPGRVAALALHVEGATRAPSLQAWTESALIANQRQTSILTGMVGGLFTAALVFAAGAAGLSGRPFARWAALFLAALLFADLAAARAFDDGWLTSLGGPYGLFALALSLGLATGSRLVDHVAPYQAFHRWGLVLADGVAVIVLLLGFAAFIGVDGTGLVIRILAVTGAAAAAGYLAHCGRLGVAGARRLAPAAVIFALVTAAAALRATGLFGTGVVAPAAIAGFSAVGAILVALTATVAAAEPSVERLRAMRRAHGDDDVQAAATDEAIAESREHSAVAASHQGVFDLDLDSGLLSLSAEAATILGLGTKPIELSREAWLRRLHPADRETYLRALATYRRQPDVAFRLEFRARGPNGQDDWYELRATMSGQATEAERCLGLIADVTARKDSEPRPAPAKFDSLTGLGNRLALFETLEAVRAKFADYALAVFDLDRFKSVNASLGPESGDELLRAVAARLVKDLDKRAKIFRAGGDMFAVLAPKPKDLAALGEAVRKAFEAPFTAAGREIFLPVSTGIAAGDSAEEAQDFLARAELAMVQAKREGGGRATIYSDELVKGPGAAGGDPVALDTNLRRALERGEIEVHYQPIMRVADGSVAGFEALLRWRHPEHGMIEPGEFIPYAERTGLILPLGKLALERAAEDLGRWQHYFPLDPPLFVSVNISWRQIAANDFAKDVKEVLKKAKLGERTLRLEVTESKVAAETNAEKALKRLSTLGAGLAIDDFGTGHSSLEHLRRFPFDAVKIDKGFLAAGEKEKTILASMVRLAHELGLQVVAEGVESEEDARRLRDLDCEFAQGFFFGAPLPAADVPGFIAMTYAR